MEGGAADGRRRWGSHRIVAEISTGLEPEGVAVDVLGRRAYVACARSNTVSVVDLARAEVVVEVAVGREPMDIAFDEVTGRLFTADLLGEYVSVVDTSNLGVVASVAVGSYPSGLALDGGRRRLHCGCADLRLIIEAQEDMQVVGEAETGADAVARAKELEPNVVLMDIRMPELDGIAAGRELVANGPASTRILMLTTFDVDQLVYQAMRAGASGFLLKSAPPARLTDAIRVVGAGEALLAPSITRRLIEDFVRRRAPGTHAPEALAELTDREREVLALVARGLSNAEIAAELVLSEATVKTHVNRILAKLDLRDRTHAVVFAYENGVVQPGQP